MLILLNQILSGTETYRKKKHRRQYLFSLNLKRMKVAIQNLRSLRRSEFFGIGLVALFALTNASISNASQSSILQRGGYNTAGQENFVTALNYGLTDRSYLSASIVYSRSPAGGTTETDTFYQGTLGFGYAISNLAFDVGFTAAHSPLQQTRTLGGSFGLTYIYTPSDANAEDYAEQALAALHTQVYEAKQERPPLFWVRFGYLGNSMTSTLLPERANNGKETALTADVFYPYSNDLLFNFGVSFHGYDDRQGFYDGVFQKSTDAQLELLSSTIQGLPHTTISNQATYKLAQRDWCIPRYTATEIDSSRIWVHTFDLGWRHQFSKNWYLTPNYEITLQSSTPASAVSVDILYVL